DSRTSDAIAIALRVKCDIYTTPEIVRGCGVVLEDAVEEVDKDSDDSILAMEPEEIQDETKLKKWLSLLDADELSDRLDDAISDENYEYAKMYKDEIRRREEEGGPR
ncbi:bifunctional nuclease domain-containing protein, partial [uncultured Parabacteroides sp.]